MGPQVGERHQRAEAPLALGDDVGHGLGLRLVDGRRFEHAEEVVATLGRHLRRRAWAELADRDVVDQDLDPVPLPHARANVRSNQSSNPGMKWAHWAMRRVGALAAERRTCTTGPRPRATAVRAARPRNCRRVATAPVT